MSGRLVIRVCCGRGFRLGVRRAMPQALTWAPGGLRVPDWAPEPGMEVCHRLAWLCLFDLRHSAQIFLYEYPGKIPFDSPFATTGYPGANGSLALVNCPSPRSITVIDVAARLQNLSFLSLFQDFADECFECKATMAAIQSVFCQCPDDVHPPGNHMGLNLESLTAIENEVWTQITLSHRHS